MSFLGSLSVHIIFIGQIDLTFSIHIVFCQTVSHRFTDKIIDIFPYQNPDNGDFYSIKIHIVRLSGAFIFKSMIGESDNYYH